MSPLPWSGSRDATLYLDYATFGKTPRSALRWSVAAPVQLPDHEGPAPGERQAPFVPVNSAA